MRCYLSNWLKGFTLFSFISLSCCLHAFGSGLIIGSESSLTQDSKAYLRSVVQLRSDLHGCTATFISDNILITASHCVSRLEFLLPRYPNGREISLKINGKYYGYLALKVSRLPEPADDLNDEFNPQLTDVALLLVKPSRDCNKSPSINLPKLEIAKAISGYRYSNQVVLAGYASRSTWESEYGQLHAGYNHWLTSNYSYVDKFDPGNWFLPNDVSVENVINSANHLDALTVGAVYVDQWDASFQTGEDASSGYKDYYSPGVTFSTTGKGATSYYGDSGGPAIAYFENEKNYRIVGIDSGGNTIPFEISGKVLETGTNQSYELDVKEDSFILTNIDSEGTIEDLTSRDNLVAQYKLLGLVDNNGISLKNFKISINRKRIAYSYYSSLFTPVIAEFLVNTISEYKNYISEKKLCP